MRVKCKQNDTRMYHYSIVPVPIETDKSLLIFRVCKYINRDTCMHTEFAHRTRKKNTYTPNHCTKKRRYGRAYGTETLCQHIFEFSFFNCSFYHVLLACSGRNGRTFQLRRVLNWSKNKVHKPWNRKNRMVFFPKKKKKFTRKMQIIFINPKSYGCVFEQVHVSDLYQSNK